MRLDHEGEVPNPDETILETLSDRIVSFDLNKEKTELKIREECDGWFAAFLNKDDVGRMIAELQAIHTGMKECPTS